MPSERLQLEQLTCQHVWPEGREKGTPILLIHGLGGGLWGWESFQNYFAECGYASYALELPGHGEQADPNTAERMGTYSVESYALWAAAAMARLEPCVVVGHSMGGLVAQKLAESRRQPGYVFLASAPPWHMFRRAYWPMWRLLLRHPWNEVLKPLGGKTIVLDSYLQDELVNNRLSPEVRAELYCRDVPDSGRASMQMVVGLVSVDAQRVDSPCLVIAGEADRLIPPSEQRRLAEFYRCPFQMFDRGHMLMIEPGWEEVAEAILTWTAAISAPADIPARAAAGEGISSLAS